MIFITSVNRRTLLDPTIVLVLVVCAVFAWIDAIEQIKEIQAQARFKQQIAVNLKELQQAIDEMPKR